MPYSQSLPFSKGLPPPPAHSPFFNKYPYQRPLLPYVKTPIKPFVHHHHKHPHPPHHHQPPPHTKVQSGAQKWSQIHIKTLLIIGGHVRMYYRWSRYISDASSYNRSFPCMAATYPYAITTQRKARKTPGRGLSVP